MGLKDTKNSARSYNSVLQLSGRGAKLHLCIGTKVSVRPPCKIRCNISLVVNFGRFSGKSLQQKFLFRNCTQQLTTTHHKCFS